MRNWRTVAVSLCLVLLLPGCLPRPHDPVGGPAPVGHAESDKPPAEAKLPALPLWSPTGLSLTGEDRQDVASYTYASVTIGEVDLQPVRVPGGVLFLQLQGDEVWLHGTRSARGGYTPLMAPRILYRLPLKVGDSWQVEFPGTTGAAYSFEVEAVEPVATPSGERPTARVTTRRNGRLDGTEWWAPGYGLVRTRDSRGAEWTAAREVRESAKDVEAVGRPAPNVKAILWDDGTTFRVTTLDGVRELFRTDDAYWRSSYRWARIGAQDVLMNLHTPGSWGLVKYTAKAYDPATGRMAEIPWVSSAGESEQVSGLGDWSEDGVFRLNDFTGYPIRWYTYRYDGKVMRAEPTDDQVIRVGSAQALVDRLIDVPPLGEKDLVAMFQHPTEGRSAWQALQAAGWSPIGGAKVVPLGDGAFEVTEGKVHFRVRVVDGAYDFQLREFEMLD